MAIITTAIIMRGAHLHALAVQPAHLLGGLNSRLQGSPTGGSWALQTGHDHSQHTQLRGLKVLRRRFPLPAAIEGLINKELQLLRTKKAPPPRIAAPSERPLLPESRRVGCIAYKAGMTQDWDEHGARLPLTVLWIDDCQVCAPLTGMLGLPCTLMVTDGTVQVVGLKWQELHGYNALQLGAGFRTPNYLPLTQAGFYLSKACCSCHMSPTKGPLTPTAGPCRACRARTLCASFQCQRMPCCPWALRSQPPTLWQANTWTSQGTLSGRASRVSSPLPAAQSVQHLNASGGKTGFRLAVCRCDEKAQL
jgi:hypothetical protein